MKIVGFVPSKLNSERLPEKNVRPLAGVPLVNYVLRTLHTVDSIEDVVVYASDDLVMSFVEPELRCRFVRRPMELDLASASVQDFVGGFLNDVNADVVVLLHVTSPFISASTVEACVGAVTTGGYESAFAALEIQRFAWYKGMPLNYQPNRPVPRTQDLEPVLVEQSGLYVFTRELFERSARRVADRPYIHVVGSVEGHDIDTLEEFEMAEILVRHRSLP